MELSPKQQTTELIKKSKKILIAGKKNPDGDTIGSILALSSILSSLEKEVTTVVTGDIQEVYRFLPEFEKIKKETEGTNDFVIKLDASGNPVKKVLWSEKEGVVEIIITPSGGTYSEEKVTFKKGSYDFDLIIILDTPDVENIDKVYDSLSEVFFEKPVINIDHHAGNEYFGTVNLVDINATSTSEILVSIIEALGANLLDEKIATNLLAGIIYDTDSFKGKNTTPKSLTVSAQLLAAGGNKQEIVESFYKTRSIENLKLYGKILSGLSFDEKAKFLWSKINYEDFKSSGLKIDEIQEALDELLGTTPEADTVLLLIEKEKGIFTGKLKGLRGADVLDIAKLFGGNGSFHLAEFEVENIDASNLEKEIVDKISEKIKVRLGVETDDERRIFIPLQKLDKEKLKNEGTVFEEENSKKETDIHTSYRDKEKEAVSDIIDIIEDESFISEIDEEEQGKLDDAISEAIKSIDEEEGKQEADKANSEEKPMASLGDVLKDKGYKEDEDYEDPFYDEEEVLNSENEITHFDNDNKGEEEIRTWNEEV